MAYTPEEEKQIDIAFDNVIQDLNKIRLQLESKDVKEVRVSTKYVVSYRYYYSETFLYMSQNGIFMEERESDIGTIRIPVLKLTTRNKQKKYYKNLNYKQKSEFIRNYSYIREKVISGIENLKTQAESIKKEHENEMKKINEIGQLYHGVSDVEIDLPQTTNQQQIEVTEENRKKIGTINFGHQTIRIITDGDIVVVNKDAEKVKRK